MYLKNIRPYSARDRDSNPPPPAPCLFFLPSSLRVFILFSSVPTLESNRISLAPSTPLFSPLIYLHVSLLFSHSLSPSSSSLTLSPSSFPSSFTLFHLPLPLVSISLHLHLPLPSLSFIFLSLLSQSLFTFISHFPHSLSSSSPSCLNLSSPLFPSSLTLFHLLSLLSQSLFISSPTSLTLFLLSQSLFTISLFPHSLIFLSLFPQSLFTFISLSLNLLQSLFTFISLFPSTSLSLSHSSFHSHPYFLANVLRNTFLIFQACSLASYYCY